MDKKALLIFCLLVSLPFLEGRRGGSSGGSRGSSGARTSSGGSSRPSSDSSASRVSSASRRSSASRTASNVGKPSGGSQPTYGGKSGGSSNTVNRGQSYNPGWSTSSSFSKGAGTGSVSSATKLKYALGGAAVGAIGGIIAYKAGKAIIRSATTPFPYNHRQYYFDQSNYRGPVDVPRCSAPLSALATQTANTSLNKNSSEVENVFNNLEYENGSRPKEIVWSCNSGEVCCGTDCCPSSYGSSGSGSYGNSGSGSSGSSGQFASSAYGIGKGWLFPSLFPLIF